MSQGNITQDGQDTLHAAGQNRGATDAQCLTNGVTTNSIAPRHTTPLHIAVQNWNQALVEQLLPDKTYITREIVNARDELQNTPLHTAIAHSAPLELIKVLINHGADLMARSSLHATPLDMAILRGNPKYALQLIDAHKQQYSSERCFNLETTNQHGETYLFTACSENKPEVVIKLVEYGCDLMAPEAISGITAFSLLCDDNRGDIILTGQMLKAMRGIEQNNDRHNTLINAYATAINTCVNSSRLENIQVRFNGIIDQFTLAMQALIGVNTKPALRAAGAAATESTQDDDDDTEEFVFNTTPTTLVFAHNFMDLPQEMEAAPPARALQEAIILAPGSLALTFDELLGEIAIVE